MPVSKGAPATTYTLTHEDGSAVTPQEVYDAFMSGPVILESRESDYGEVETVLAIDYEGTPDNITTCRAFTVNKQITLGGA